MRGGLQGSKVRVILLSVSFKQKVELKLSLLKEVRVSTLSPCSVPDLPQLAQETIFSRVMVLLFLVLSPRQKSQYGLGLASSLPRRLGGGGRITAVRDSGGTDGPVGSGGVGRRVIVTATGGAD